MVPHVNTPGGLFRIGVRLAPGAYVAGIPWAPCVHCGAGKVHPHPRADVSPWRFFCFGCGRPS